MIQAHIFITGNVIGVGFRSWALRQAQDLKLVGWVKNVHFPKKGVEAVFEGEKRKVENIVDLCKKGPEVSWVEKVEVKWEKVRGEFKDFTIER